MHPENGAEKKNPRDSTGEKRQLNFNTYLCLLQPCRIHNLSNRISANRLSGICFTYNAQVLCQSRFSYKLRNRGGGRHSGPAKNEFTFLMGASPLGTVVRSRNGHLRWTNVCSPTIKEMFGTPQSCVTRHPLSYHLKTSQTSNWPRHTS